MSVRDPAAVVAAYCRRHGLLPRRRAILALVSGGADSTCLMGILREIHDGPVLVLTVDHGLRPEAVAEVEAVERRAAEWGLPVRVARLSLDAGAGVQERARDARLRLAHEMASEEGCAAIATGHTASDQAETVLFRLARGTGRTGALGMAPKRESLVRPLLDLSAADTRRWCAERGLAVAEDPSNEDPRYARARVRSELLPALSRVSPGAERHVAELADLLRDESELVETLVREAWDRCASGAGLNVGALAREPAALRRLLVRRLVGEAGLGADARSRDAVERALAAAESGVRADLPGGAVAVEAGILVAFRSSMPPTPMALSIPGRVEFGELVVSAEKGTAAPPRPDRVAVSATGPFAVRSPRPGDRVPLAGGGRQAVGRLLAAAGVPARGRPGVPVVAQGEQVIWVAGHRAAPDALAEPGRPATVLAVERA